MLTYLVQVTESLLVVAVLSGFAFAFARYAWKPSGRRVLLAGCVVGWITALTLACLRNQTKLIDSGLWNIILVNVYLVGFLVFMLLHIPPLRQALKEVGERLQQLALGLMLLGASGYLGREFFEYPFDISLAVTTMVSTDFFFRVVGWVLGFVLMLLLAESVYKLLLGLNMQTATCMCVLCGLVTGVQLGGLGLRAMLTKRMIPQIKAFFSIAVFASNGTTIFCFAAILLALACVVMVLVKAARANEPYDNPAQHRKIRAKWRSRRRWAAVCSVCALLSLVTLTAIKAYDSREVELSPSEEFELRDDGCYVSLEQVDDGHLHRFTYESPDGVGIRFIVIKKPGSGKSYGIGLDACDICGETGYYERDGNQVVCKLCDVVMNVQTIGFKGGCNPIVIDYEVKDGYIRVPFKTLLEHEEIFTR